MTPPAAPAPVGRLLSLDAFRGLIMFTLLFGGAFGSLKAENYKHRYEWEGRVVWDWHWLAHQGDHVKWEGCTYWDLIQPAFTFIVGVAIPIAAANRYAVAAPWLRRFRHTLVRAAKLFLVGVVLDNIGERVWNVGAIRVLQQLAISYVLVFFLVGRSARVQAIVAGILLVGYTLFWMYNPYNGPDVVWLTEGRAGSWLSNPYNGGDWPWRNEGWNVGKAFDDWFLSLWDRFTLFAHNGQLAAFTDPSIRGRNYRGDYVTLNAIPSTANMIFGVMAGQLLISGRTPRHIAAILFAAGLAGVLAGYLVGGETPSPWVNRNLLPNFLATPLLPLVKRIWTPSFAVFSAGWVAMLLAAFYWLIDVAKWKGWAFVLVVVGMNSIAAYCLSGAFGGWFRGLTGAWVAWLDQPTPRSPWFGDLWAYDNNVWFPVFQRVLFAAFAWAVLYWLYRRKIFFRL